MIDSMSKIVFSPFRHADLDQATALLEHHMAGGPNTCSDHFVPLVVKGVKTIDAMDLARLIDSDCFLPRSSPNITPFSKPHVDVHHPGHSRGLVLLHQQLGAICFGLFVHTEILKEGLTGFNLDDAAALLHRGDPSALSFGEGSTAYKHELTPHQLIIFDSGHPHATIQTTEGARRSVSFYNQALNDMAWSLHDHDTIEGISNTFNGSVKTT